MIGYPCEEQAGRAYRQRVEMLNVLSPLPYALIFDIRINKLCRFRKPAPVLLLRAARELGLDPARSWMVGDRWRDVDCGKNAGCRTVFIDCGYAEELRATPDFTVCSFADAVDIILAQR